MSLRAEALMLIHNTAWASACHILKLYVSGMLQGDVISCRRASQNGCHQVNRDWHLVLALQLEQSYRPRLEMTSLVKIPWHHPSIKRHNVATCPYVKGFPRINLLQHTRQLNSIKLDLLTAHYTIHTGSTHYTLSKHRTKQPSLSIELT